MRKIGSLSYETDNSWEIAIYENDNVQSLKGLSLDTARRHLFTYADHYGQTAFKVYADLGNHPERLAQLQEIAGWVDGLLVINRDYSVVITIPHQTISLPN